MNICGYNMFNKYHVQMNLMKIVPKKRFQETKENLIKSRRQGDSFGIIVRKGILLSNGCTSIKTTHKQLLINTIKIEFQPIVIL